MARKYEGLPEDDFVVCRKKKGLSKLDRKKVERVADEMGLPPDPVLTVEPEPILEPEIKIETPELKSNPGSKAEIEQKQNLKPEKKKEIKEEEFKEEEFKEGLKQIKTREELLAHLESLGEAAIRSEKEGSIFFPAYISEIRKSLDGKYELNWKIMREKIREITGDRKTEKEKEEKIKKAKESEDKKFKENSQKKKSLTQKDADVFEASSKNNGNKRVYAKGSTPEDAKEKTERIKNEKAAELESFKGDGKKYFEQLQAIDWSKYRYDENQKKDLARIELETLLEGIIEKDSKFFKKEAKRISKELAKIIIE